MSTINERRLTSGFVQPVNKMCPKRVHQKLDVFFSLSNIGYFIGPFVELYDYSIIRPPPPARHKEICVRGGGEDG